jgi:hypothetical protein
MIKNALYISVLALAAAVLPPSAHAAPASFCASNFSSCNIFEDGQTLSLPGLAIAGDLVLLDRFTGTTSDVFRIFNNIFDSGGGTGLGVTAFFYSEDLHNLPNPATYSVNVVFINEAFGSGQGGAIETDYNGNGTLYRIFSIDDGSPEPSTFVLLSTGAALIAWRRRRANGLMIRIHAHRPFRRRRPHCARLA